MERQNLWFVDVTFGKYYLFVKLLFKIDIKSLNTYINSCVPLKILFSSLYGEKNDAPTPHNRMKVN